MHACKRSDANECLITLYGRLLLTVGFSACDGALAVDNLGADDVVKGGLDLARGCSDEDDDEVVVTDSLAVPSIDDFFLFTENTGSSRRIYTRETTWRW